MPRTAHVTPAEKDSETLGATALEQLLRLLRTASGRPRPSSAHTPVRLGGGVGCAGPGTEDGVGRVAGGPPTLLGRRATALRTTDYT